MVFVTLPHKSYQRKRIARLNLGARQQVHLVAHFGMSIPMFYSTGLRICLLFILESTATDSTLYQILHIYATVKIFGTVKAY